MDGIGQLLRVLHRSPTALGIEELTRLHPELARSRTVYRWHRTLGDQLTYFPSIAYQSIGLTHLHVIITEPQHDWRDWPYAIRALWMVRGLAQPVLYLHCLVPQEHVSQISEVVRGREPHVVCVVTNDGQQFVKELGATTLPGRPPPAKDLLEEYPLVVPVIGEQLERRASLQELWETIYRRLGDQAWQYLPKRARRLPHNGKQYVRRVLTLLNEHGIFTQYIIRYEGLAPSCLDLMLVLPSCDEPVLALLGKQSPVIEHYPGQPGIVTVSSTTDTLKAFFTAQPLVAVLEHYFIDHERNKREPLPVRFAYERLFEPLTSAWVLPQFYDDKP